MPLQLVSQDNTPLPPIFGRLRLVETPPDEPEVTFVSIPTLAAPVSAYGGYDAYPGSLFPGQVDKLRNQPHPQMPDAIMALETFLIGGTGPTLPGASFTGNVTAVPPAAFIGNGALPPGGTTGQVLAKTANADYAVAWQTPSGGGGLTIPLSQDLTFAPDATYNVGATAGSRPRNVYLTNTLAWGTGVNQTWINGSGGSIEISAPSGTFFDCNVTFGTDNTYDIGASGFNRPRNVYAGTSFIGSQFRLTGGGYISDAGGTSIWFTTSAVDRWLIHGTSGSFLALTDNAWDIGASGANRPRDVHVGRYVITANVGTLAANTLWFLTNSTNRWAIDPSGYVIAATDNLYDIGALGANRPRNLYVAGFANFGSRVTTTNVDTNLIGPTALDALTLRTTGTARWQVDSSGNFLASTDNTYDIGQSGSNRPRNIYAGSVIATTGAADASPYTQKRISVYEDPSNWGYLGYGVDAVMRIVYGGATPNLWFGTTTKSDNTGVFTRTAALSGSNFSIEGSLGFPSYSSDVFLLRDAANTLAQRNGANQQTFNLYQSYTNASNYQRLSFGWNGPNAYIQLGFAGTGPSTGFIGVGTSPYRWQFTNAGWAGPEVDNNMDIGQSGANRPRNVYVASTVFANSVTAPNNLLLASGASSALVLGDNFQRWEILSGHFLAVTDNAYDIGASGANRPRNVYVANQLYAGLIATPNSVDSPAYSFSGGQAWLFGGGPQTIEQRNATNPQTFRIYNSYVDANNYSRLRLSWSGNFAYVLSEALGTGVSNGLAVYTNGQLMLGSNSGTQWSINGGNFVATADNTYDIGASAASRPRYIYAASGITIGNDPHSLIGGTTNGLSLFGNLTWNSDNAYDIGAVGNSPRNLYVGSSASIGVASANYVTLMAAGQGNLPGIGVAGSAADQAISIAGKGNGGVALFTNNGYTNLAQFVSVGTSAANYLRFQNALTGNYPILVAAGSDAVVGLDLYSQSAGGTFGLVGRFLSTTVSTPNWLQFQNGGPGVDPRIMAQGGDAAVALSFNIKNNNISYGAFRITGPGGTTAVVDYVEIAGGNTGLGINPTIKGQGSDTNIHLGLGGKGTGMLYTLGDFRVGGNVGFYATNPIAKPTVSGAKGSNAALGSLMAALASLGLVTDSTTA